MARRITLEWINVHSVRRDSKVKCWIGLGVIERGSYCCRAPREGFVSGIFGAFLDDDVGAIGLLAIVT